MNAEVLKGHLDLLLLAAVQARPAHGYAIALALRARSADALDLSEGTLYPALHRLERGGLLASHAPADAGRDRACPPRGRARRRCGLATRAQSHSRGRGAPVRLRGGAS